MQLPISASRQQQTAIGTVTQHGQLTGGRQFCQQA
jgi:hypothetical protein